VPGLRSDTRDEREFRTEHGMVYVRRHLTTASDFCRHCGLSVGRKVQGKTLLTDWTGLISFVMNIGGVAQNGKHLRSLAKLGEPMGGDPSRRMAAGHSMFKRPMTYVPIAGLALIMGLVIKEANKPNYAASVGACVHFNAKTERLVAVRQRGHGRRPFWPCRVTAFAHP
jgi:hypothetical protein